MKAWIRFLIIVIVAAILGFFAYLYMLSYQELDGPIKAYPSAVEKENVVVPGDQ